MKGVYYNEHDEDAAGWLERLIAVGALPAGDVDRRDVREVRPDDIKGYFSAHFFAGIGGWPLALRSVGWRDDRPVWTASVPCQGFSRAGKRLAFEDPRHLWPAFAPLVAECRPPVLFGEQSTDYPAWLELVRSDLDRLEYAVGAMPFEAACAGSEHGRPRYYFVADADDEQRRREQQQRGGAPERAWDESRRRAEGESLGYAARVDERGSGDDRGTGQVALGGSGAGDGLEWVRDTHGKVRRRPPGIRGLADGVSGRVAVDGPDGQTLISRVATLKGFGNALDQRAARSFVAACMNILIPILGLLGLAAIAAFLAAIEQPGVG
ncbi:MULTISPECIES: DNA cytosine methyltransferase [Bradyrhizobium]|uniref:DNA (Cytosine-5)-methyltransferase 1 n=1 Tax=Bradyrhizobium elkanii TaxID=29448 RepID=A0A8I1Y487_BRAEL|nr:DNA cytosine methyltransferase [Bradyrhizobium elkanii]MBP1294304.1 DNA (cytosine-5)-methyltransferase 1 [Bradyrhizobium elkanii]